ncbi:MAG: hypothetical protein P4L43_02065, partial [Syntrophobacteraceae bacterium]|nr:hypothetical protein [Syntrophobacteraceae bacterium]
LGVDPFSKLRYLGHLLAEGAGLWAPFYGNVLWLIVCVGTAGLIVVWIFFTARARHVPRAAVLSYTVLCLPLSMLPMLAVKENELSFRTQFVMEAIFVYLVVSGLSILRTELYARLKQSWIRFGTVALLVGLVVVFAFAARYNVYTGIVKPNAREVAALSMAIRKMDGFPQKVTYIVAPQETSYGDSIAEFGVISSPMPWVTRAMLELIFIKEHEGGSAFTTTVRRHDGFCVRYGAGVPGTGPVVDGFHLLAAHLKHVHDRYWGDIQQDSQGWCLSNWLGVFNNRIFPYIFNCELGWLFCSGKGLDDYWFWNPGLGWFWTSPGVFPNLYLKKDRSWVAVSQTIGVYRIYYYKKKKWETFPGPY